MKISEICAELMRVQADGATLDQLLQLAALRLFETSPEVRGVGIYELDPGQTLTLGPWVGDDACVQGPKHRVAICIGDRIFGEIGIQADGERMAPEVLKQARRIAACLAQNYELRRSLCG